MNAMKDYVVMWRINAAVLEANKCDNENIESE